MKDKTEMLRQAVNDFQWSNQSSDDYMDLFVVIVGVTRQGSGLLWSDVKKVVKEVIDFFD